MWPRAGSPASAFSRSALTVSEPENSEQPGAGDPVHPAQQPVTDAAARQAHAGREDREPGERAGQHAHDQQRVVAVAVALAVDAAAKIAAHERIVEGFDSVAPSDVRKARPGSPPPRSPRRPSARGTRSTAS